MRKLIIKYSGQVNYLGTRRYIVFEDEKPIATVYTANAKVEEVAHEYWKELKETEIIIEYDVADNEREY